MFVCACVMGAGRPGVRCWAVDGGGFILLHALSSPSLRAGGRAASTGQAGSCRSIVQQPSDHHAAAQADQRAGHQGRVAPGRCGGVLPGQLQLQLVQGGAGLALLLMQMSPDLGGLGLGLDAGRRFRQPG